MIEFISLSRRPEAIEVLRESISLSLDPRQPWNLTVVDGNTHDLFTGYNAGIAQTRGPVLVFVHDDLHFLGNALTFRRPLELLSDPATGFIGVVGSRVLPASGLWWGGDEPNFQQHRRGSVYGRDVTEFGTGQLTWPLPAGRYGRVLILDGMLLICTRRTIEKIGGFDATHYKGFHFYDVDTTFRAALAGLNNYAAPIPVFHNSFGTVDDAYMANRDIFLRRFGSLLPARISDTPENLPGGQH